MAYDGRYDDPKYINAFLADLKLSDEELAEGVADEQSEPAENNKDEAVKQVPESKTSSGINTPAAASPHAGIRAPPSTPEGTIAWKPTILGHLPPINEDQYEECKNSTATGKQPVMLPRLSPKATPFVPSSARSSDPGVVTDADVAPRVIAVARGLDSEAIQNYHQYTVEKFKAQAEARVTSEEWVDSTDHAGDENTTKNPNDFPNTGSIRDKKVFAFPHDQTTSAHDNHSYTATTDSIDASQNTPDESTAISDGSDDDDSSVNIIVDAPRTPESFKSRKSLLFVATSGKSSEDLNKIARERSALIQETAASPAERDESVREESREDAIYFSNWGAPSIRNTPPARVRKVLLKNLPPSTDFTLVQSLIHGGIIDEMTLSQSPNGTMTASIIFADPDACDSYFNAYPNGLEFRYKGMKHVAVVDKGRDVDVISSVLLTYLDFGATRVVKASGADKDWSMRALYKIAGGASGRRKVEAIVDSYRNDNRTITFRFTKIADAVAFRSGLVRNSDWEHADVQFAADPCERATGIHTE